MQKREKFAKQAGAELGQAQLTLELDYTLIFCRFDFSILGLEELLGLIRFLGFIKKIWFGISCSFLVW